MKKTLKEIAEYVGGVLVGDGNRTITGVAGIREAKPGQLSFIINEKYAFYARNSSASALVVDQDLEIKGFDLIRVDDPARAWDQLLDLIRPPPIRFQPGIHSTATVSKDAVVGSKVVVMAHVTIEPGAIIGDRCVLYPGVYLGHESRIGEDCVLYPHVVIRERVKLGHRVIVHAGAVVGSDGFGYTGEARQHKKQEQFGTVILEDDVEIGANVTIDRARFDATRIGRGTKIDNLVQIAHNVTIGENSIVCSQAGIAGSTHLGKNVILAGQVGVAGHIQIGDNVIAAAKAGITKNLSHNSVVYGNPAGPYMEKKREAVSLRKIPGLLESLRALSERVSRLETQPKNNQECH